MVNWSKSTLVPTVSVTARIVELLKAAEAEEISAPAVMATLGTAAVLNSNPAGALSTSFNPEPVEKSFLLPSVMTIGPSVVHAGEVALAALSAEMLVPLVAGVIVTNANVEVAQKKTNTAARPARKTRHRATRAKHGAAGSRPAGRVQGQGCWEEGTPTLFADQQRLRWSGFNMFGTPGFPLFLARNDSFAGSVFSRWGVSRFPGGGSIGILPKTGCLRL